MHCQFTVGLFPYVTTQNHPQTFERDSRCLFYYFFRCRCCQTQWKLIFKRDGATGAWKLVCTPFIKYFLLEHMNLGYSCFYGSQICTHHQLEISVPNSTTKVNFDFFCPRNKLRHGITFPSMLSPSSTLLHSRLQFVIICGNRSLYTCLAWILFHPTLSVTPNGPKNK